MLDFRGADAEGEGAERPMRRGVRIAAHDQQPGLRQPQLGTDHVDDALPGATHPIERDGFATAVLLQR